MPHLQASGYILAVTGVVDHYWWVHAEGRIGGRPRLHGVFKVEQRMTAKSVPGVSGGAKAQCCSTSGAVDTSSKGHWIKHKILLLKIVYSLELSLLVTHCKTRLGIGEEALSECPARGPGLSDLMAKAAVCDIDIHRCFSK